MSVRSQPGYVALKAIQKAVETSAGAIDGTVTSKVGGQGVIASVAFSRPANTTLYAALDAVGAASAILEVLSVGRVAGGSGYIVGARLSTNNVLITPQCRLHLFTLAPTAIADNAPFPQLWADRLLKIGTLDLSAMATEGTGSDNAAAQNLQDRVLFKCDVSTTSLFVVIETLDAFTPTSGQLFLLKLFVDQN